MAGAAAPDVSPQLPYSICSQIWIFCIQVGAEAQSGMAHLLLYTHGQVLWPTPVRHNPVQALVLTSEP